jgi:tryptophan synthase beta subunit
MILSRLEPDNQSQFIPYRTRRAGHFGIFGGRFVAETLMPLILDLEEAYDQAKKADPAFRANSIISTRTMPAVRRRSISPSG